MHPGSGGAPPGEVAAVAPPAPPTCVSLSAESPGDRPKSFSIQGVTFQGEYMKVMDMDGEGGNEVHDHKVLLSVMRIQIPPSRWVEATVAKYGPGDANLGGFDGAGARVNGVVSGPSAQQLKFTLTGSAISRLEFSHERAFAGMSELCYVPEPAASQIACTQQFPDVPAGHPACGPVGELVKRGIVTGYPDGTFQPDRPVTRAEFTKMLLLSLSMGPQFYGPLFYDVTDHWVAKQGYVQAALQRGIISGFPDKTFRPDDPVTRAQGIKMAVAGLAQSEPVPGAEPEPADMPTDVDAAAWYRGDVARAIKVGMLGKAAPYPLYDTGTLQGDLPMTRAETAMLLANLWRQR